MRAEQLDEKRLGQELERSLSERELRVRHVARGNARRGVQDVRDIDKHGDLRVAPEREAGARREEKDR